MILSFKANVNVNIWENVTMMDSLKIIASCDLEFG